MSNGLCRLLLAIWFAFATAICGLVFVTLALPVLTGRLFHSRKAIRMYERAHIETLLNALDATPRALRRDASGNWHIGGKHGQIFADGKGYLIVVQTDESSRRWTNVKRRLSFCRVTQDGDDEGCLHLDRLPTAAEAALILEAIHIRRCKHLSPEVLAAMSDRLSKVRDNSPSSGQIIRPIDPGLSDAPLNQ